MFTVYSAEGKWLCEAQLLYTFFRRLRGIAGKNEVEVMNPVLLFPCRGIHTFFMKFSIDAFFIGRDGGVLNEIRSLEPSRVVFPYPGTLMVLESPTCLPRIPGESRFHIPGLIENST
jgi:uncharacterized membrane protein (UPF0127 family)